MAHCRPSQVEWAPEYHPYGEQKSQSRPGAYVRIQYMIKIATVNYSYFKKQTKFRILKKNKIIIQKIYSQIYMSEVKRKIF